MYTLISPLIIPLGKKFWAINLNIYRNSHFRTLHTVKLKYKKCMEEQIKNLPEFSKIHLTYTLYPKTYRKCDISNICSITDKFFSDCLVELEKLKDDNYTFIPKVSYVFGHVDKDNPHVLIQITPIK